MSCPIAASDWRKVRQWADGQVDDARRRLEGDLDDIDTATQRGRIRVLRALIEWGEPREIPELIATPDYRT